VNRDEVTVGMGVIYEDGSGKREDGIVTSVNDSYAFVRYAGDHGSKATRFEDLEPLRIG
jgi:hypothetical protein